MDIFVKEWSAIRDLTDLEKFNVSFQAIVDLETSSIFGYEALLRGPHPTETIIKDAVHSGYIKELDAFAHDQAISLFSGRIDHYHLFLNCHPDSIPTISPCTHKHIVYEITEHKALDYQATLDGIKRLKRRGIKIALDDFGKGLHTEFNFKKIQPDIVKVDRSIIRNIHEPYYYSLCTSILDLCRELNLPTVAEGIETIEQFNICRIKGFTYGQGFFIGKPLMLPMEGIIMNTKEMTEHIRGDM